MPQDQHHEGPQLRQAQGGRWFTRCGHSELAYDYDHDVGYLHYGDYALWSAGWFHLTRTESKSFKERIGRYLDGEEEREGLYR